MNRWSDYKNGETEPLRMEGTAIGKAAVAEFVRGLTIRESSPFEPKELLFPEHKYATAAFHFFKWLAEVPGWETDGDAKVMTAWTGVGGKRVHFVSNMLAKNGDDRYMILQLGDIIAELAKRYTVMAEQYEAEYNYQKEVNAI